MVPTMTNSRTKGAAGEREFAKMIHDHLGLEVTRNLDQTRDGGYDLLGIPGWAVEVKRYKTAGRSERREWWQQSLAQARDAGLLPVVIYRLDRQPWRAMVAWQDKDLFPDGDLRGVADIDVELWFALVRETLN